MLAVVGVLVFAGSLSAHHAYATFYDVQKVVILRGEVSHVSFSGPHANLTIETGNSGRWRAEWTNPNRLMDFGITVETIQVGDFLEIHGSPAFNPDNPVVSALREIRRRADGWSWTTEAPLPRPRIID